MDERNYGIDLLKIISMLFIIILHMNYIGGLIEASSGNIISKLIVNLFEVVSLCAVNIYALISGYLKVSVTKNRKYFYSFKRITYLWLEVVFYSLITSIILSFFGLYKIDFQSLFKIFTPVSSNYLWYFTAYFGLFFFEPILTTFIEKNDKKDLLLTLVVLIIVFSIYPIFMSASTIDFWFINYGYSVWWLIILFLIGGIVKKCELEKKIKRKKVFILLMILYAISFLAYSFNSIINVQNALINNFFCQYNSITTLIISICYLLLFANFKLNYKIQNVVKYFSLATFGVYVMHLHPVVWELINNKFIFILKLPIIFEPFFVIIIASILLIIMLLIDKFREYLFKKLRIDKLCLYLDETINFVLGKIKKSIKD